jgi:flagellar biosynthesis/type III secretory pathway M-ring protein FliF/YscJ
MATWIWTVVAVIAVFAVGIVVFGILREKRLVRNRQRASRLREEAAERAKRAEERGRIANEQARQAHAEREEAAKIGARADRLDPDR